ncbi:putative quinol monooxygenase [Kribbella sp. NPDC020789]
MYGGLARFVVRPGKREELLEVVRWSARLARDDEPGTLRLDVWAVDDEPDAIYVYEAYTSREAFELHIKNPAVQRFGEIAEALVEGWSFVIPFGESLGSSAD